MTVALLPTRVLRHAVARYTVSSSPNGPAWLPKLTSEAAARSVTREVVSASP
eukprot:CAMPEP_0113728516 /NCGR_PEP_ID=MMETSP0038_2-20120614/41941_1 /TAXON_ID=2898 /ORGANISM="Cryptomonas paramecium" /LENGTH=51 /DNA_ID=CAMNT_0000660063 /DNA_START=163 /DNA_END=314 /DNA_ORIENTATION=+ /assembly_acc=CAM_ASM_000170